MHLLLTLLVVIELSAWGCGDAYLQTHQKAYDASVLGFESRGFEEEASVFRTMRERRSLACNCGKGTKLCVIDDGRKYCECPNNTWVIDHPCEECSCPNGVCDGTSTCRCQKGYGLRAENICEACNCGDDMPCKFVDDMKLCICYDKFLSINRGCKGCSCGMFELCLDRQEERRCSCSGKLGSVPECPLSRVLNNGDCDCNVNEFCMLNITESRCRCMPNQIRLDGTCIDCKCDDENAICDFQNGTKVCSCKNRFVEHNGTCVECFCGEGHSCELKNGSTACICLEGHIEHEGICKECICAEGEDCELVDGRKLCLCKENYIRVDGICKECFCGKGHGCSYIGRGKLCTCQKYFAESDGTCKECHCGGGHDCEFLDGKKNCLCSPGFIEKNGICLECFCGNNSVCTFHGEDKNCICNRGSIVKNGMCHEICRDDTCDRGTCEIDNDTFKCSCDIGFGGDRCEQKLAVSKEASYVISTLAVVTLFWIILVALYFIRKRRKRDPSYRKVSRGGTPDDGIHLSTVASNSGQITYVKDC